jgi:hypothetical protein
VYALSKKIQPVIINKKAKWNYMGKIGAPGHMEMQMVNFDKLVDEYNSFM